MPTIFDNHCHCFPPMGGPNGSFKQGLAEHQYHVRFHGQGARRTRDNVRIRESILAGEKDGISGQPDRDFRPGKFGRVEFTYEGEDYYTQWMPPTLWDMSSPPEYMVAQMDYVGVDRAVLQHDRIYGRLDDYLSACLRRYPDRFVVLAQVDEWVGGRSDQLDRLKRQVEELGHSGVYFSTGGFFHDDFQSSVNDAELEPLWELVQRLGITVHWYAAKLRLPAAEDYLGELREFFTWAERHPGIPSVLTHGMNNLFYDKDKPDRFSVPDEIHRLVGLPDWRMELMLHLMAGDTAYPPYEPGLEKVMRELVESVGAESLVWGSDMPACERTVTYKQSMLLFTERCDFLTDDQRALIMGGNLASLYPL